MPYTAAGQALMLNTLAVAVTGATQVTLYSDNGGVPQAELAAARDAVTWNPATQGTPVLDSFNAPVCNVAAGETPAHVCFINDAGDILAYKATGETTYTAPGTYTVTDADLDLALVAP